MSAMPSIPPWLGIAIVIAMVLLLGGALHIVQRKTDASPETVRKVFHLGGGAIALGLPWLFDELWPVLLLSGLSMVGFVLIRVIPVLRRGAGQILQAVPRETAGEFWFLLGVTVIYAIAGNDIVVYSIGILILAVADTAAALVGIFYGQHSFDVPGGIKSAEGSIACLLTAFLCVHVPVLLFTDAGRLESLLVALNISLLIMFAEAGAARGSDNFVLPILVVVFFKTFLEMPVSELVLNFLVILALVSLGLFYRNRTTLSADALIVAVLAGYIFWFFGGWRWTVAPVVLFATYTRLVGRPRLENFQLFHADVILAVVSPSVFLVTVYKTGNLEGLYLPYVAVWSAILAIIATLHGQLQRPNRFLLRLGGVSVLKSLVVMIPGVLVGNDYRSWALAATFLTVPAALATFNLIGRSLLFEPTRPSAWWNVSAAVSAGALVSFGLLAYLKDVF